MLRSIPAALSHFGLRSIEVLGRCSRLRRLSLPDPLDVEAAFVDTIPSPRTVAFGGPEFASNCILARPHCVDLTSYHVAAMTLSMSALEEHSSWAVNRDPEWGEILTASRILSCCSFLPSSEKSQRAFRKVAHPSFDVQPRETNWHMCQKAK